jgi:hypothetical protein
MESDGNRFVEELRSGREGTVRCVNVEYVRSDPASGFRPDAIKDFGALADKIGPAYRHQTAIRLSHGKVPSRGTGDTSEISRKLFGCGPIMPHVTQGSAIQIGFVLPICKFGGAERATMNFGRESRRRGWTPHLFIVGSGSAQLLAEFRETFETITVIEPWQLCRPDYLLGLLGTMDVVVNNLCTQANEASGLLRRHGAMTICHLHSVIVSSIRCPAVRRTTCCNTSTATTG